MDYKKVNASETVKTRDINAIASKTGNIYEAVVICSKRANEINKEFKKELSEKLGNYVSYSDNLEEVHENKEQIEVSRHYEKLPKPSLIALEELLTDNLWYSQTEEKI